MNRKYSKKISSLGFPTDPWSVDDWTDFYFSLKSCADRMRMRRRMNEKIKILEAKGEWRNGGTGI